MVTSTAGLAEGSITIEERMGVYENVATIQNAGFFSSNGGTHGEINVSKRFVILRITISTR